MIAVDIPCSCDHNVRRSPLVDRYQYQEDLHPSRFSWNNKIKYLEEMSHGF